MVSNTTTNQMPAYPFVGLNPFSTDEAILFFGRREHTVELLQMLRQTHFIAVVGSSGCGKSSLIRAGLIPQLKAGFLVEARDQWRVAVMKPGEAPLKNLANAFAASLSPSDTTADALTEIMRNGGAPALVKHCAAALAADDANLLLLVDQFEELFRFGIESKQPDKREEAEDFVSIMLALAAQSDLPCFIVMTMRSDFIGECDNFYGLPEALNRSQFLVPRLTREQRRQAIEGPIRLFNAAITPRLLDRVVNDVGDHSDQLPVMQHALMRTWEHWQQSSDSALDLPHYTDVGGIQEALSRDADAALQALPEADQTLAKRMFQALTDTDARNRRIRRPAHVSDIASITDVAPEKILELIENFKTGGRSFLILSNDADPIIDISHESLIRQWATMSDWVNEEAESRDMLLRLENTARYHRKQPKDENFWRGSQLEMALEWWNTRQPNAAWADRYCNNFAEAKNFLDESRIAQAKAEAEKEAQRKQALRRTQKIAAMLSVLLIAALSLAFYAWRQQTKAKEQEQYAKTQERNARRLTYIANMNLAADAIERDNLIRASDLLLQYLPGAETNEEENYRSFYWYHLMKACRIKGLSLSGHAGNALSVAWSADGKTLASGSVDKTIKLWDVSRGKELRTLSGHKDSVLAVAWSSDGRMLASGSADKTIRLWDVASGKELHTLEGHGDVVSSVAWSSDSKTLVSGGYDKTIKLWDVASGKELRTLSGHGYDVTSVAWSSDGKTLASGSADKTIKLWDVASGKELRTLEGHGDAITSVAWSSDGKVLASGSVDKTIKLWDMARGKELRTLSGHKHYVLAVAWSADGKTLASGSNDKMIKLWDVVSGRDLRTLSGHEAAVTSVAWSSDGKTLASGSRDMNDFITGESTIKLWDVARGKELRTLEGHRDFVTSVAWSSDGKVLASGSADKTIKLWDVASGKELRTLNGHGEFVLAVAWSSNGKVLASGSADRTIKLWDVASGKELRTLTGHGAAVRSVAWSGDGKTLASGSYDNTVKLWDVTMWQELRTLKHEADAVLSVAFSPDGSTLASGSYDPEKRQGVIQLWFGASEEDVARQRSK